VRGAGVEVRRARRPVPADNIFTRTALNDVFVILEA
jgi:hypothetical protein